MVYNFGLFSQHTLPPLNTGTLFFSVSKFVSVGPLCVRCASGSFLACISKISLCRMPYMLCEVCTENKITYVILPSVIEMH